MGYRHPILEPAADARLDLLAAAVVLGAHLDAPEGEVDDELLVRALCAFMDARACYLASHGPRYAITLDSGPPSTLDSGPPSTHSRHSVLELVRRFGLT
jgi:hypothetical protein